MEKTLIIRTKLGGTLAIELKSGDALPVHLATFSRGNMQGNMFFAALNAANAAGMIDSVELDLSPEDAVWVAKQLGMRSPHTAIERVLANGTGLTIAG